MTLDLCDALREHLETSLKNIKLPTRGADLEKDGPARNLKIIDGYLPTKEEDSEDPYPFVLVRANSAQLSPQRSQTEVSIVVGTYGKDSVGYRDAVNVLDAVYPASSETKIPSGPGAGLADYQRSAVAVLAAGIENALGF